MRRQMYIKPATSKSLCKYVRPYPPDCVAAMGKVNFVKTLGTRNIAEANKRQKDIDDLYDAAVANVRSQARMPLLERQALVAYLKRCKLLAENIEDIDLATVQRLIKERYEAITRLSGEAISPKFDAIDDTHLPFALGRLKEAERVFLQLTGMPRSVDVHRLMYKPEIYESSDKFDTRNIFDKVMDAVERIYPPPQSATGNASAYKLRHVYEKWEQNAERSPRQKLHVGRAYRLLKEWCGDRPISSYTKQEMRDLLAALQRMPIKLPPEIKALPSFKRQYDAVTERNIQGETRAGQTIQNIKDAMSALFQVAINDMDVDMKNPVRNISIDAKKGRKKRIRYDEEDLKRIFHSPLYKGFQSLRFRYKKGDMLVNDAKFWLPLIGLFCGARQEEMAQVHITDVFEEKGVTYLHINDWDEDKTVKTEGSIRTVPVHHHLIRLGFLDYVQSMKERGETRLFPDLKLSPDGRYAKEFSKWYGRICRHLGIEVQTKHTRKDFHSYRHTFITAARTAGIPPEITIQIVGHGEGDFGNVSVIHRGYGIYEPHILNEALQKIHYSELDLSHLYFPVKEQIPRLKKNRVFMLKVRRP